MALKVSAGLLPRETLASAPSEKRATMSWSERPAAGNTSRACGTFGTRWPSKSGSSESETPSLGTSRRDMMTRVERREGMFTRDSEYTGRKLVLRRDSTGCVSELRS